MTVSATPAEVSYSGAGSAGPFSFPFYFLSGTDLRVILVEDGGSVNVLEFNDGFTVTGEGEPAGGEVTLDSVLAVGQTLSIALEPVNEQDASYVGDSPFPSETTEQALDRLTMITKRLQSMQTRSRVKSLSSSSGEIEIDLAQGYGFYRLNMVENIDTVTITNPPLPGEIASFILELYQDDSGGYTYAASNAIHAGDTLVTTAGAINRIYYTCDFAGDLTGVVHADFD